MSDNGCLDKIIADIKARIASYKVEWKLTPFQENLLEHLEGEARKAEAEGNKAQQLKFLQMIDSAFFLREGIESRRTKGVSDKYKRVKTQASGK